MKIDFKSLAFNFNINAGGGTPAWETALGQGAGYKFKELRTIDELVKGMVYKAVSPKTITFKKGKGGATVTGDSDNASLVIASVFDKVFINDQEIVGGKFVLLIAKDDTEHHKGRLKLKYGLDNTYKDSDGTTINNRDFKDLSAKQLGLAEDACWFVYDISVEQQDTLRMRAIIVNEDGPMTYDNTSALHAAWDPLIEADSSSSGSNTGSVEQTPDVEVIADSISDNLSIADLAEILSQMYGTADNKTTAIHMFGFKYADVIISNGYTAGKIVKASEIPDSYETEVAKGIAIYKSIERNEYGVHFYEGINECEVIDIFAGFESWLTSPNNPDYTGIQKYNGYPKALMRLVGFMEEKGYIEDDNLNDKDIEKYNMWLDIYCEKEDVQEYDKKYLSSNAGRAALKKYISYIKYLLSPHAVTFDYAVTAGNGENRILFGTPGCGKSYHIEHNVLGKSKITKKYEGEYNKENIIRTTFYQDYSNTDFVGQILPKVVKGSEGEKDTVEYIFNPGPFTLALIQAISNPYKKVALVIEEINRGNAPAIFGDIFQLLDRDENSISEYGIVNVSLIDYLNDYEFIVDGQKKKYNFTEIKIPGNMYIFGTMNTSDQNVYTLDTAFIRRWEKEKIKNTFAECAFASTAVPGMSNYTWKEFVDGINGWIAKNLEALQVNEDKQIGAFFVKESLLTNGDAEKFAFKVFDYLWSDVAKLDRGIFFNHYNTLEDLIKSYKTIGVGVFKPGIFEAKAITLPQSEANDEQ